MRSINNIQLGLLVAAFACSFMGGPAKSFCRSRPMPTSADSSAGVDSSAEKEKLKRRAPLSIEQRVQAVLTSLDKSRDHWFQSILHRPLLYMSYCEGLTFEASWQQLPIDLQIDCKANDKAQKIVRLAAQRWNQAAEKNLFKISTQCSKQHKVADKVSTFRLFDRPAPSSSNWLQTMGRFVKQGATEAYGGWPFGTVVRALLPNWQKYCSHYDYLGCVDFYSLRRNKKDNKEHRAPQNNWRISYLIKFKKNGIMLPGLSASEVAQIFTFSDENNFAIIRPRKKAQYIAGADIFVDSNLFQFPSDMAEFLQLNVVMHEMGHALGLRHQPEPSNIMSAGLGSLGMLVPFMASSLLKTEQKPQPLNSSDFDFVFDHGGISDLTSDASPAIDSLESNIWQLMKSREFVSLLARDKVFSTRLRDLVQIQNQDKKALQCLYDL